MSRVTQECQNCLVVFMGVSAAWLLEGESVTLRSGSKGGRRRVARGIAIGRGRARVVTSCQWSAKTTNHLWLVHIGTLKLWP